MPSHDKPILPGNQQGQLASTGYEPEYEEDVIKFPVPGNLTPDQAALTAEIVNLDHHSLNTLKPKTRERQEVKRLLLNAVNALESTFESGNDVSLARSLYQEAETAFYHYLQAKNRVKYLFGMVIGVLAAGLFGGVLLSIFRPQLEPFINAELLIALLLFAGMGSIASVLTRLSSIDLKQETNDFMIIVSGATRPVVAIFFAIVVYLILDLKIVGIQFGTPSATKTDEIYLISSFLCGFSERFAEDIISRAGLTMSGEASQTERGE